jgi:nucleotide-binding universal stress UspA family protein
MLERFVVPLDTSATSARIIPYVTELAKRLGQPAVLLAVLPHSEGELNPLVDDYEAEVSELIAYRRKYAHDYLDTVSGQLRDDGVWATTVVAEGDEAATILATAAAKHAGLIAMATHGRVGPQRWFLGSVADKVIRNASTPVLLIRPRADGKATPPEINAILVPVDGSELAEAAFPYATFLAKNLDTSVTLFRSVPLGWSVGGSGAFGHEGTSPDVIRVIEDEARGYLERTAERLRGEGIQVDTCFARFAEPASEIADLTEKMRGALIVMSSHGRSGLGRTLLGSVADKVIRSSGAPVLVVRPTDEGHPS